MRGRLLRLVILCHRWLGITWCLLFALWFSSGIVMMYWSFPEVEPADRLERSEVLNASLIRVPPVDAWAQVGQGGQPDQVRVRMMNGRPIYRFRSDEGPVLVFADNGQVLPKISSELAAQIASAWTGQSASAAKVDGPMTVRDQWTITSPPNPQWPLLKYSWPNGEDVYVSTVSGDVVQHTTRGSRIAAYFGAIPHWMYFTALRKDTPTWRRVVLWSSGTGVLVSLLGLVVGVWIYSPRRRYRVAEVSSSFPYSGFKRWHAILGLIFGVITCTWGLSGMLSMIPFPALAEGPSEAYKVAGALSGGQPPLFTYSPKPPAQAIRQVAADIRVKEIEFTSFAGEPVYLARETPKKTRIVPVNFDPAPLYDPDIVATVLARAVSPLEVVEARLVDKYEAYYLDRHGDLPLPALFVRLNDPSKSTFYVDLNTARLVAAYSTISRWNRWLYHGFHSLDFPWLYHYRPAWDVVVMTLLLAGLALSVTAVAIAWQVLRGKIGRSKQPLHL
jgi:hypothetical protein